MALFGILFYQIRLYSDFFEQIYYLATCAYGWWLWSKFSAKYRKGGEDLRVTANTFKMNLALAGVIGVLSLVLGFFMSRINLLSPVFFPEPASFPYRDAFTTVMCFFSQFMMTRKKIECWYLWTLCNIIGIVLYAVKGVIFVSGLYVAYLMLAFYSYYNWKRVLA